jgi:hypothetical protein
MFKNFNRAAIDVEIVVYIRAGSQPRIYTQVPTTTG